MTNNLKNRVKTHESGKGSKYVRARLPIKVIYVEKHPDKKSAAKREWEIKSWTRSEKIRTLRLPLP